MIYKAICLSLLLGGCASAEVEPSDNNKTNQRYGSGETIENQVAPALQPNEINYYQSEELVKNVNDYAKWLTQDLFSNLDFPNNNDTFIVANFALLDSNLNKTNHFGRQMTEAMTHQVHRTGFSVIDVKASGFIRMTETGDIFYQSEDHQELSSLIDATHVITGTLTKHKGGYFVNAKVVLLENKSLMSSAQIFVPYDVVDAVLLEDQGDPQKTKKTMSTTRKSGKQIVTPSSGLESSSIVNQPKGKATVASASSSSSKVKQPTPEKSGLPIKAYSAP